MKKTTPFPTPTFKKLKNSNEIFLFDDILIKKLPYLILRSGKFGNLVTSFLCHF